MLPLTSLLLVATSLLVQDHDTKASPFDGVRWSGGEPEIQIGPVWYVPVAIDGVTVDRVLAFCDRRWPGQREKRFCEDLVEALVALDWEGDLLVDLDLRTAADGSKVRLEGVEMTLDKRQALAGKRARFRQPRAPALVSAEDAREDLDAFGRGLKERFAYLGLGGVDLDRGLDLIRSGLTGDSVEVADLRLQLHRVLMCYRDGHARVRSSLPSGEAGDRYLPFLLVESSAGVTAVLPDRSALVEPEAPVVQAIDGRSMDEWVDLARPYIAKGSQQLVRRRALQDMREIDVIRRILGLETGMPVRVTFATTDGSRTVDREIPTSSRRPKYGAWPRSESGLLDGDVGYLRIEAMDGDVKALHEAMGDFASTRGLIVDVRGNGGGTREHLLALGGYLVGPEEPAVVGNVARYRRAEAFEEDHLEARYMYRADWQGWSERQRQAIGATASTFEPEWQPAGEFSAWHYLVLDRTGHAQEYFYDKPVVLLCDAGCFSATDIFLGALELLPRVSLLGTASSGGSARTQSFRLPRTGLEVRCASMASFRPDGRLYDGRGIEVDVEVLPEPTDFLKGAGDAQLRAALSRL